MLILALEAVSHETASFERSQLENCYKSDSSVSIDPQRNTVTLTLIPNLEQNCVQFPRGVRFQIKFESQQILYRDITDFSFETTVQVVFKCAASCAYLETAQKVEIQLYSAEYVTIFTPGASLRVKSDFSECFTENVSFQIHEHEVCFLGQLNGICDVSGYTFKSASIQIKYANETDEIVGAASRATTDGFFEACIGDSVQYAKMATVQPELLVFYELFEVAAAVDIQIMQQATQYFFSSDIEELTDLGIEVRAGELFVSFSITEDFKTFMRDELSACNSIYYVLSVADDVDAFEFAFTTEYVVNERFRVGCDQIGDDCAAQLLRLMHSERKRLQGYLHIIFSDVDGQLLHEYRAQASTIRVACLTEISFYSAAGGMEALYDLTANGNCGYREGDSYFYELVAYEDEKNYLLDIYEPVLGNSAIAGDRLVTVEYNEAQTEKAVLGKLEASYAVGMLISTVEQTEAGPRYQYLEEIANLRSRLYLANELDFIKYSSVFCAIFVAISLVIVIVLLVLKECNSRLFKKKQLRELQKLDDM